MRQNNEFKHSFEIYSCSYWSSQLIISLIRYCFVMFPIRVHNYLPTNNYKNKLFFELLKYKITVYA